MAESALEKLRRELELERAARQQAEATDQLRDGVLAALCHEMRSLLHASLGWAHLLQEGRLDPKGMHHGFEVICRNVELEGRVVSDILDVSRILSGRLRLDVQSLDLRAVVTAALDSVRAMAEAKAQRLQPELDAGLGLVRGDPKRLQQVLRSLLANAVEFTPDEGRIRVIARGTPEHAEVVVEDGGQGIPAELLPHVFDRLRNPQAYAASGLGGRGLGLAIARHVVELHGGTLEAASDGEGTGARVTLRLPLG